MIAFSAFFDQSLTAPKVIKTRLFDDGVDLFF